MRFFLLRMKLSCPAQSFALLEIYDMTPARFGHSPRLIGIVIPGQTRPMSFVQSNSGQEKADAVRMQFLGSNEAVDAQGDDLLPGTSNYFIGNDPAKWRTNIPTYAKVRYPEVYKGIDLVYYGNQRQLEFDFIVAPNADPKSIRLQLKGAAHLAENASGALIIATPRGDVLFNKPVIYQLRDDGSRRPDYRRFSLDGGQHSACPSWKIRSIAPPGNRPNVGLFHVPWRQHTRIRCRASR